MPPLEDGPFRDFMEGRRPGPPSAQFLGWRCLEIDPEAGNIVVEFQTRPECLNPVGAVSGGFLAEMLDQTMASAVKATLEPSEFPASVEFKVNFIRPARPGRMIGRARVVHGGKSLAFVEGELRTSDDKLIATSSQTVRIVTIENMDLDFGPRVTDT
jgi:uncharacterized protein (TIGR00369 family)